MRKMCHELQYLQTLEKRCLLEEEAKQKLQKLERGFTGEVENDRIANLFVASDHMIDNFTICSDYGTIVQIDKLVISETTAYVIDMKNYQGDCQLENGQWTIGSLVLEHNILEQLRRAVRVVENIFKKKAVPLDVKGVLMFMNPATTVTIKDKVPETILSYTESASWYLSHKQGPTRCKNWRKGLQKAMIPDVAHDRHFSLADISCLTSGIHCPKCGRFDMVESHNELTCACGYCEPKKFGYLRTICECGTIFYDHDLTLPMLRSFFGKDLNERYLKEMLHNYFEVAQRSARKTSYVNKGVLFEYWFINKGDYFNKIWVNFVKKKKREQKDVGKREEPTDPFP